MWPAGVDAQSEDMSRTDVPRGTVAFHVLGGGSETPLLLINGGPGFDHRYLHWAPVWDRVAKERPVVFFDQPGTGQSYPVGPGETVTVRDVLEAMRAVQAALGWERIAILGHSWGGYLAMAFALEYPDATESVVLIDSGAPNPTDTEFNFSPLFPDSLARGSSPAADPDGAWKDLRRQFAMSFYSPSIRQIVTRDFPRVPLNARQRSLLIADASRHDLWQRLGEIRAPVLVGTGRFDANVAPRTAWRIHEAIPQSKFYVWERSGHYPMIEEPDEFVAVVSRFLATGGSSAGTVR
jgi:proline iminopeptidase